MTELRKWNLIFQEQHKQEVRKERERHAAQAAGLKSELDSLKELLKTYETSSQRKDEVAQRGFLAFACTCCADWLIRVKGVVLLLSDVSFQIIANLSQVLDRQKEKIEKMRIFAHWRVKHTEVKEEVK